MSYVLDSSTGDLVIAGFEQGIGVSPYTGLTDERNINITSTPGEAAVNFATSAIQSPAITGSITSASSSVFTYTGGVGLENYIAVYLTATTLSGSFVGTPYWVANLGGGTFKLYTDYQQSSQLIISGTGTATFVAYQIGAVPSYVATAPGGAIKFFAQPGTVTSSVYPTFGVDGSGLVWSNFHTTGTNAYWTYTGNAISDEGNGQSGSGAFPDNGNTNASGNGLVYWKVNDGGVGTSLHSVDYLFVFRNSQIDFFVVATSGFGLPAVGVWTYGWSPSLGSAGNFSYLNTPVGLTNASHQAIVSYDGRVYFCDGPNIQKFYQTASATLFIPTTIATYTPLTFNLLPINDNAQCLSPLGVSMLIGGQGYNAYLWNTTANLVNSYIPIAEPFISSIVTVNTNAYLFAGNRGRIYITNGSQAQLWTKIPDHISGTVEPKFQWGGTASVKNQLYFGVLCTTATGSSVSQYGGVWAIDLASTAIRLSNKLSYGTYTGYASALIPQIYNPTAQAAINGVSLMVGWDNGASGYGVDIPTTSPYTGGQSIVISDMIPVGTMLHKMTPTQFELKFATPLLSSESAQILIGSSLSDYINNTFTSVGTLTGDGTSNSLSCNFPTTLDSLQWLLVKVILTGKSSNPSYNRLVQIRVVGGTAKLSNYFGIQ